MASALENPLIQNEITYDLSGLDVDMDGLYDMTARRGGSTKPHWDEESGQYYLATVDPHSEFDLIHAGQTVEDITTVDYDEPIYFVGAGSHELGEVSRQWTVEDGGSVNMSEGWMTESELKEQWNADEGMSFFKKANPNMAFDDYLNMVKDGTSRYQEAGGLMAGEQESFLAQLAADHGVQTTWQNDDGDVFNFTGGGYAKTYKVDDHAGPGDYMKMAIMAGAGFMIAAPIATALTPSLGAAGAKAASSAITNIAKQLVTEGNLDIQDALMSAALSYGGSQLSDALAGTGVVGDIGSKVTEFGDNIASGGGDVLSAALQAGGMSLVSQLVQEGEIDWKDAALAAAMAGGTTALQGFLSDIGKSDEMDSLEEWDEYDEWQQEAINADIKDPFLNPNYESVGDGLVKNINTGEVFGQGGIDAPSYGNFKDLDKDGDGVLNGNDLSEITTPDRDLKNIYGYEMGDTVYIDANGNPVNPKLVKFGPDGYVGYDANGNKVALTSTTYDQAFGGDKGGLKWEFGLNEDGSVSTTNGAVYYENGELAYEKVDGQWQDANGNVIDDPSRVDELTMIAAKAIDEPLNSVEYFDQDGNAITYSYPPYELRDNFEQGQFSGLIFGPNGEVSEVWYDPVTGTEYIKAQGTTEITAVRYPETPPEPVDPQDPDQTYKTPDSNNSGGKGSGGTSASDSPNTNNTPVDAVPPNVTNPDVNSPASNVGGLTPAQIAQIAQVAGTTVIDVISRINNGETVQEIVSNTGDTPVTPSGDTTPDNRPTTETPATTPNGGNDTDTQNPNPTPSPSEAYEARIEALMARGMSREQAEKNQAYAVNAGGDFDGDGAVTDAEWAQLQSNQNGNNVDPNNDSDPTNPPGNDPNNEGNGEGDDDDDGEGDGDGDGDGDGNGNGDGFGNGNGLMGLAGAGGDRSRPVWGQLFGRTPFRKHTPYQSKVTGRLFADLMGGRNDIS